MSSQPTVYVVDADPHDRKLLECLARTVGFDSAGLASAEEFLEVYSDFSFAPRCLILEVRLPGLTGLELQQEINARGIEIPVIMISAYADVPTVVRAMSAGAMDFLEKPLDRGVLLQRVAEAMERSARQRLIRTKRADVASRIASLSVREHEVLERLVVGKHAKQIAVDLGIGEKTVLKHRAHVLDKMRVESVAELVRLVLTPDDHAQVPVFFHRHSAATPGLFMSRSKPEA